MTIEHHSNQAPRPKPMALLILDGFGYRKEKQYNAIAQANTPNLDRLFERFSSTYISGSGLDVGLPNGQMGNSEVGHLNIGAGRMVPQELTRVDMAIEDKSFFANPVLTHALQQAKQKNQAVHVMGLLSPGGVHSHERQILAMLESAKLQGCEKIYLHAFLDGRDTPPQSALDSIKAVEQQGIAKIASITGRYYAMDRDNRWDRVQKAYDLLTMGKAEFQTETAEQALAMAYERNETDEFVQPTCIHEQNIQPIKIENDDAVIFMNFRADRARELTRAFVENNFEGFARVARPKLANFICLTEYLKNLENTEIAYPPNPLKNTLGEYLSNHNLKQLRIAETEKYAHVTFFFNGGIEQAYPGEERELIPSPDVATYDLKPEMSAYELTDKLTHAIEGQAYDVIICNYANPDMVGHTGNMEAAIKAIEAVDNCIGKVAQALQKAGGEMIITADHGNAELMFNEQTQQAHTAHTSEPVPVLYVGRKAEVNKTNGVLADLAPTILYLMDLKKPEEMTGESLFKL